MKILTLEIGDDQHDRHGEAGDQRLIDTRAIETVDDPLVEERHQRRRDLGGQQRGNGEQHAQLQVGASGWPHIGPEVANRGE